jgi:hypothetical protein
MQPENSGEKSMSASKPDVVPLDTVAVSAPVAPPAGGDDKLEQIVPQLHELAQKVGGFDKLAEIVRQLHRQE